MNRPAKKAGTASDKSFHSISLNDDVIMTPTMTRAGAVAAYGTALINDAKKADRAKQIATTTDVRPVRPPAPIPDADSTKVVVLDVPNRAPILVAVASANRALSRRDLKPDEVSIIFSSSSEKIPLLRPVPIKVPIVSNVSVIENEKIVMSTRGSLLMSVNRLAIPPSLKIAKKVVGKAATASENDVVSWIDVTPKGIPMIVVTTIAIRMPPLIFLTVKTIANKRPIKKTQN